MALPIWTKRIIIEIHRKCDNCDEFSAKYELNLLLWLKSYLDGSSYISCNKLWPFAFLHLSTGSVNTSTVFSNLEKCSKNVVFPQPIFPSTHTVKGLLLSFILCLNLKILRIDVARVNSLVQMTSKTLGYFGVFAVVTELTNARQDWTWIPSVGVVMDRVGAVVVVECWRTNEERQNQTIPGNLDLTREHSSTPYFSDCQPFNILAPNTSNCQLINPPNCQYWSGIKRIIDNLLSLEGFFFSYSYWNVERVQRFPRR